MGFISAVKDDIRKAENAVEKSFKSAENLVKSGASKIIDEGKKVGTAVEHGVETAAHKVYDVGKAGVNKVIELNNMEIDLAEEGLKKAGNKVVDIASGVVGGAGKIVGSGASSLLSSLGIFWDIAIFGGVLLVVFLVFKLL